MTGLIALAFIALLTPTIASGEAPQAVSSPAGDLEVYVPERMDQDWIPGPAAYPSPCPVSTRS